MNRTLLFTASPHVPFEDQFDVIVGHGEVADRQLDRNQLGERRLPLLVVRIGRLAEDRIRILQLEQRLVGHEVLDERLADDVLEPETDAEEILEPLLDVVADVQERPYEIDDRPEQVRDDVRDPERLDGRLDGLVQQVADGVGDVDEVDVDELRARGRAARCCRAADPEAAPPTGPWSRGGPGSRGTGSGAVR